MEGVDDFEGKLGPTPLQMWMQHARLVEQEYAFELYDLVEAGRTISSTYGSGEQSQSKESEWFHGCHP